MRLNKCEEPRFTSIKKTNLRSLSIKKKMKVGSSYFQISKRLTNFYGKISSQNQMLMKMTKNKLEKCKN